MMKIAVASQNQTQVTGHLGRCQKFWIYTVDPTHPQALDKQSLFLSQSESFHESSPQAPHPLDTVDVLIAGSMGQGLARRLQSKGIEPVLTPETDPDGAVQNYLAGTLVTISPEEVEHHHEQDHPHDHGQEGDSQGHCHCH